MCGKNATNMTTDSQTKESQVNTLITQNKCRTIKRCSKKNLPQK